MYDIQPLREKHQDLAKKLGSPGGLGADEIKEMAAERTQLEKIIVTANRLEETTSRIKDAEQLVTGKDVELAELAKTELADLTTEKESLAKEVEQLVAEYEESQKEHATAYPSILIEIRAGTGGDEAALFAADLFKMYTRYAQNNDWGVKVLDSRDTELGGYKEIVFEIKNRQAFTKLQFEGGVHRVQRVPDTEKSGRVHTSTATVAVLPRPKKAQIKINTQDLRIDTYRASGPGGQYVNRRESAIRITHLPTGLVVTSQTERSQLANKENALGVLEARLLQQQQETEQKAFGEQRQSQIGTGERFEKIRTYNFPQSRITDHRIKKSWQQLEKILAGELDSVVEKLREELA